MLGQGCLRPLFGKQFLPPARRGGGGLGGVRASSFHNLLTSGISLLGKQMLAHAPLAHHSRFLPKEGQHGKHNRVESETGTVGRIAAAG